MKVLIISDYDSTYCCKFAQYDTDTLKMQTVIKPECDINTLISILNCVYDNSDEWLSGYKLNNKKEYRCAMNLINAYDDVIICQDGDIINFSDTKRFKEIKKSADSKYNVSLNLQPLEYDINMILEELEND